jgi:hypothetical protein
MLRVLKILIRNSARRERKKERGYKTASHSKLLRETGR